MIFNIHIEYYELNVLYVYVIDNRYAYLYAYTQPPMNLRPHLVNLVNLLVLSYSGSRP